MIRCKNLDMKKYNNKSYDLKSGGGDNIKEKIYKNLPTEWINLMNLKYGLFI